MGDGLPAEGPHDRGEERRGVMAGLKVNNSLFTVVLHD
jgi:hypothetical protein